MDAAVPKTPDPLFEYEERYAVTDPAATRGQLEAIGFEFVRSEDQTDHWFIPQHIMSADQQGQWFDDERGWALRIREERTEDGQQLFITAKQVIVPHDHNTLRNVQGRLNAGDMRRVLLAMGSEFATAIAALGSQEEQWPISFAQAKQLITQAGRKEYLTAHKQRATFTTLAMRDVRVDLDAMPDLRGTDLGFWASVELEYTGGGTPEEAQLVIAQLRHDLGYDEATMLKKALPGLAIPYLARF
jgi:adenylate cyclase class IV